MNFTVLFLTLALLKWLLNDIRKIFNADINIISFVKTANLRNFGAYTLLLRLTNYPTNVLYQIAFPCFVFWYLVCLFRFWKIALFWEAPFVLSLLPINKKKQTCMYCAQNNMLLINVLNFFKHLFFWWQAIVFAYIYYAY